VLVLAAVAVHTGIAEGRWVSFSLADIVAWQRAHGANLFDPVMWPAAAAFALFFPANLGIVPFDLPEAETEVLEGPLLEYSGPALGLFKVMAALKAVVALSLGVALFLPIGLDGVPGFAGWLVEMVVLMLLAVTVLRLSTGRMRIDQAFGFFLIWPMLLGTASLLAVAVL
jgi:NADH-quinone oxidoreductase subunit H